MLTEAQINKAVEWWMAALRNPKFDTLGPTRHQQRQDSVEFAEIMASVVNAERPTAPDAIERFGHELRQRLKDATTSFYGLFVDYGPEGLLFESAEAAGMDVHSLTVFPWKTKMWFQRGGVQVACGYGAQEKEILKTEETDHASRSS